MVSVTQVQLSWLCPDSCIVCSTDAIICSNLSTIIGDEASVWFTFGSAVRTEKEMLPDYVQIQFSALLYSCMTPKSDRFHIRPEPLTYVVLDQMRIS